MSLLINIKHGLKIKNAHVAFRAIMHISNWCLFFLDFLSMLPCQQITYNLKNGLKITVRANSGDRGVISIVYLNDEYNLSKLSLPNDALVVDIGANIGVFSILASQKACKILSYEPEPDNYRILLKNIEINNLCDKITPFNLGVAGKTEERMLFFSNELAGNHSMYSKKSESIKCSCVSLKDILDKNCILNCELLKIDAEGSEYEIIYNLPENYFPRIKRIYLEYHKIETSLSGNPAYNFSDLKLFLELKGYKISYKPEYLFAERKT